MELKLLGRFLLNAINYFDKQRFLSKDIPKLRFPTFLLKLSYIMIDIINFLIETRVFTEKNHNKINNKEIVCDIQLNNYFARFSSN